MSQDDLNIKPEEIEEGDSDEEDDVKKPSVEVKEGEVQSYCHLTGEWSDRKISIFGAVKSFIGQLRAGQDLTRVSLPSIFLMPYSLLEEVAARQFAHFYYLFEVKDKKTPLERMVGVMKWLVASAKQQNFHHKPFNPIIGEVNRCSYAHDPANKENTTFFVVEQVQHHPPTSGVRIDNPYQQISVEGFYTFQVQFNRNSVTVANKGKVNIKIADEEYWMEKAMPDLLVKNVIIGAKLVVWEGPIEVVCRQTGYRCTVELSTKGRDNVVKGGVYSSDSDKEPEVFVEGKCGGPTEITTNPKHPNQDPKKKKETKEILGKPDDRETLIPTYPKSQESNSSINTWAEVAKHIIANDMDASDVSKQKLEESQRNLLKGLTAEGKIFEPVHFEIDDERDSWRIKDEKWYEKYDP